MDLEPVSSISDSKYWKDQAQFAAFNVGLQGLFREKSFQFYEWGELRTNLYAGTPFSGEAVHYNNLFNNTLNATTPEVTDFGGVYTIINQINLMISHTENTDVLNEAQRKHILVRHMVCELIYISICSEHMVKRCFGSITQQETR